MISKLLQYSGDVFDKFDEFWFRKSNLGLISSLLAICFVISSFFSFLVIKEHIFLGSFNEYFRNPFFSVEIVFTLLLITEIFGLIFILPKSVANSVSKQFELLSLIFLRDAFKVFSRIGTDFSWSNIQEPMMFMIIYGFGAIAIFTIIGFNRRLQKHVKLTYTEDDQEQFVSFKKLLGLILLAAFAIIGYTDVRTLILEGYYLHSFHAFYTVLIFSDIVIVLVALRYTHNYFKIFRYSAFVLATILIRISLSVKPYYDVLFGVLAAVFIFVLTLAYNYFLKTIPNENKEQ